MKTFKKIILFISIMLISSYMFATEYHVAVNGKDTNKGSKSEPFKTIQAASNVAIAGDIITVHKGTYREWVNPICGGESDVKRIVYRVAPGEKVHVKGSEIMTGWKKVNNGFLQDKYYEDKTR